MSRLQTSICKACSTALSPAMTIGNKNGFDFLCCPQCRTVTVSPFPTPEELMAFYQSYKGTVNYRDKAGKKLNRASKRLKRLMRLTSAKRFLDVGCNYGFTVKAALDLGLDAKGIDIDNTAVSQSKESYGTTKFETISVQDYAARGEKADIIYTSEVIEHVPDPDSFVQAIAQILDKDGILYLTTPDAGHWRRPKEFTQWEQAMPPEHITYFTRKGISALLQKHGLKVESFTFTLKPNLRLIARKMT